MTAIERLRALEKKYETRLENWTRLHAQDQQNDADGRWNRAHMLQCQDILDDLRTLIAELGQEVGAVGDSRRPSDAALAVAFWDARKTINESPDWVTPVEVIHWGDEIVRRAREYGTRTSPAHTSEARDAAFIERLAREYSLLRGWSLDDWNNPAIKNREDIVADMRMAYHAAMRQEGGTP